jgi:hypothetical protein
MKLFMEGHPELSLRKPQAVSAARVKGFNRENVSVYFSILETEMEKIKCSLNRLFNVDETGITVVQHETFKVISLKGKRQVASLSPAERGALMTVVTEMLVKCWLEILNGRDRSEDLGLDWRVTLKWILR